MAFEKSFFAITLVFMLLVISCTEEKRPVLADSYVKDLVLDHDLDELILLMAEKDLVLLGESTHGTQEYYELRSTITKRLIKEHDFRFIAVEGDWNSIYELNLYVKGLRSSAADVRFHRWPEWMWDNEVIRELAEWLRLHNEKSTRIGIYGMDVYDAEQSLVVAESLGGRSYPCLSMFRNDFTLYARYISEGNPPCVEAEENYYSIKASLPDDKESRHIIQSALVVKNTERHYRAMAKTEMSSWNERVLHMNQTVAKLSRYGKGIVWAHNTHVGDARASAMAFSNSVNIGQLLREANKSIYILGFGTYTGTVLAARSWGSEMMEMVIPPARSDSYEHLFESMGLKNAWINLKHPDLPSEIKRRNNNRAVGVIYNPEYEYPGNYVDTDITARYDSFIFIRNTTALKLG